MTSRRVLLIGSGGTIASTRDGGSASVATVTAEDLMARIPPVDGARITRVNEWARINSWALVQDDMLALARLVCAEAADPEVDGIVVTHGTDTIERSAFLADLLYTGKKPVVFVGAMRPADDPEPDGPGNLARTLDAIGSGVLDDLGVGVLVGADVHAARAVTKVDSRAEQAVASPGLGPLAVRDAAGEWRRAAVVLDRVGLPIPPADLAPSLPVVPIVVSQPAPLAGMLPWALQAGDGRAIVVEGMGAGNLAPALADEIKTAAASGALVAISTCTLTSGVHPSYRGPGGNAELVEAGAIGARTLTSAKTSLLLATLLAADSDDLAERFTAALDVLSPAAG